MWLAESIFWLCLTLLAYVLLGYPLLIRVWSRLRPCGVRRGAETPVISLIVVARNEAPVLTRRLHNLLDLDYPRDRLEILVGSSRVDLQACKLEYSIVSPK